MSDIPTSPTSVEIKAIGRAWKMRGPVERESPARAMKPGIRGYVTVTS